MIREVRKKIRIYVRNKVREKINNSIVRNKERKIAVRTVTIRYAEKIR